MPNIEIHGFGKASRMFGYEIFTCDLTEVSKLKTAITKILTGFPFAKDAVITTHSTKCQHLNKKPAPFLRICDTDTSRADDIAEALMPLKIDIEVMQLYAFYPASEFPEPA